ncbi:chemotaxis protein CheB [Pseudidiomarina homiensis]|uniref:chemotaxis protein CheB n=1 Tax=Pseudidiomarina homiensis TaxID=364198 RepID=UPI00215B2AAA|nr:chemotaxis protein CheB [Pseudidiomarina homiensis]
MKILVVDDSKVIRLLLTDVLEAHGHEVATAESGEQALAMLQSQQPDIITMDVHMPGLDGYETTAQILERFAIPIVILTASDSVRGNQSALRALEAGALAIIEKPQAPTDTQFERQVHDLLRTLRVMHQVKVVRRPAHNGNNGVRHAATRPKLSDATVKVLSESSATAPKLIIIAASAGGPATLRDILHRLDKPFHVPIVVIQHIAPGFSESFSQWLQRSTGLTTQIAKNHQRLQPGTVLLPPDGYQLGFSATQQIYLQAKKDEHELCPAADFTMQSAAQHFQDACVGIVLSGMGRDGSQGMLALQQNYALTLVQQPDSAAIQSMPKNAIEAGAAREVLPPAELAESLNRLNKDLEAVKEERS